MTRVVLMLMPAAFLAGCSLFTDRSGPIGDVGLIRSRSLGGVTLGMKPATLVKDLATLGYVARFRRSTDGLEDDIVTAYGTPNRHYPTEMCAPPNQPVELAIRIRSGRLVEISCLSDGSREIGRFTNRFVDTVNGRMRIEVSVIAMDHALTSFRAINAANTCPFLRSDPFKTADDVDFCRQFKPTTGPYVYSYSLPARRFPSGHMTVVSIQDG